MVLFHFPYWTATSFGTGISLSLFAQSWSGCLAYDDRRARPPLLGHLLLIPSYRFIFMCKEPNCLRQSFSPHYGLKPWTYKVVKCCCVWQIIHFHNHKQLKLWTPRKNPFMAQFLFQKVPKVGVLCSADDVILQQNKPWHFFKGRNKIEAYLRRFRFCSQWPKSAKYNNCGRIIFSWHHSKSSLFYLLQKVLLSYNSKVTLSLLYKCNGCPLFK